MDLNEIGREGVDWIILDQVRERWRGIVSTVMNLKSSKKGGNVLD
jgi:hypothetical protein